MAPARRACLQLVLLSLLVLAAVATVAASGSAGQRRARRQAATEPSEHEIVTALIKTEKLRFDAESAVAGSSRDVAVRGRRRGRDGRHSSPTTEQLVNVCVFGSPDAGPSGYELVLPARDRVLEQPWKWVGFACPPASPTPEADALFVIGCSRHNRTDGDDLLAGTCGLNADCTLAAEQPSDAQRYLDHCEHLPRTSHKAPICHATHSSSNPYDLIPTSTLAIVPASVPCDPNGVPHGKHHLGCAHGNRGWPDLAPGTGGLDAWCNCESDSPCETREFVNGVCVSTSVPDDDRIMCVVAGGVPATSAANNYGHGWWGGSKQKEKEKERPDGSYPPPAPVDYTGVCCQGMCVPELDLALKKQAEPAALAQLGEQVTFTLTVTNKGPQNASAFDLLDRYPTAELGAMTVLGGLSSCAGAGTQCSVDAAAGLVRCLGLGPLADQQSCTVVLSTTLSAFPADGSCVLQNRANVTLQGDCPLGVADSCEDNNAAEAAVSAQPPCPAETQCTRFERDVGDFCGACREVNKTDGTVCMGVLNNGLCDGKDTCQAGVCTEGFLPATTVCRESTGQCDAAEYCSGTGSACPLNVFAPSSTPCSGASQGGECDDDPWDRCLGTADVCVDSFNPSSVLCGDQVALGPCDAPDTCNPGSGQCDRNPLPATTVCRAAGAGPFDLECDRAEHCDGLGACPADQHRDDGALCGLGSQGPCDAQDRCTAGLCVDERPATGSVCGPAPGPCFAEPVCAASGAACPPAAALPIDTLCGSTLDTSCRNPDRCSALGVCEDRDELNGTLCQVPVKDEAGAVVDQLEGCCQAAECRVLLEVEVLAPCDNGEIAPGATVQLAAIGAPVPLVGPVSWAASCGSVTPGGLFTAPAAAGGSCVVTATDAATGVSGDVTLQVVAGAASCHPAQCPPSMSPCVERFEVNLHTGLCEKVPAAAGTLCRNSTGPCDPAEVCLGPGAGMAAFSCPADLKAAEGVPCGDPDASGCNAADTCNAYGGVCVDRRKAAGTQCAAASGECQAAPQCDGVSTVCPAEQPRPAGVACGDPSSSECDEPDTCDGAGACAQNHASAAVLCGDLSPGSVCNPADTCNPATGLCQQALAANGTVCVGTSHGGACDAPTDACDGAGACVDRFHAPGTECRASAGQCDVPEQCTGLGGACPADQHVGDGSPCSGQDAGPCAGQDTCAGGVCTEQFLGAGTTCRNASGDCDVAEMCCGDSPACPVDAFLGTSEVCREAAGACDLEETCTGFLAACPADALVPSTVECRAAGAGIGINVQCDVAETCDGNNTDCPADAYVADGGVDNCQVPNKLPGGDPHLGCCSAGICGVAGGANDAIAETCEIEHVLDVDVSTLVDAFSSPTPIPLPVSGFFPPLSPATTVVDSHVDLHLFCQGLPTLPVTCPFTSADIRTPTLTGDVGFVGTASSSTAPVNLRAGGALAQPVVDALLSGGPASIIATYVLANRIMAVRVTLTSVYTVSGNGSCALSNGTCVHPGCVPPPTTTPQLACPAVDECTVGYDTGSGVCVPQFASSNTTCKGTKMCDGAGNCCDRDVPSAISCTVENQDVFCPTLAGCIQRACDPAFNVCVIAELRHDLCPIGAGLDPGCAVGVCSAVSGCSTQSINLGLSCGDQNYSVDPGSGVAHQDTVGDLDRLTVNDTCQCDGTCAGIPALPVYGRDRLPVAASGVSPLVFDTACGLGLPTCLDTDCISGYHIHYGAISNVNSVPINLVASTNRLLAGSLAAPVVNLRDGAPVGTTSGGELLPRVTGGTLVSGGFLPFNITSSTGHTGAITAHNSSATHDGYTVLIASSLSITGPDEGRPVRARFTVSEEQVGGNSRTDYAVDPLALVSTPIPPGSDFGPARGHICVRSNDTAAFVAPAVCLPVAAVGEYQPEAPKAAGATEAANCTCEACTHDSNCTTLHGCVQRSCDLARGLCVTAALDDAYCAAQPAPALPTPAAFGTPACAARVCDVQLGCVLAAINTGNPACPLGLGATGTCKVDGTCYNNNQPVNGNGDPIDQFGQVIVFAPLPAPSTLGACDRPATCEDDLGLCPPSQTVCQQRICVDAQCGFANTNENGTCAIALKGGAGLLPGWCVAGECQPEAPGVAAAPCLIDLGLQKTSPTAMPGAGQPLVYVLTVTNHGLNPATAVEVVDTLPNATQVTYLGAVASQGGPCAEGPAGVVSCALGTLAGGAVATVNVTVQVNADGVTLHNSATVSAAEADAVPGNNVATLQTGIPALPDEADLQVVKTLAPGQAAPPLSGGGTVQYLLNVTNNGPDPATAVALADPDSAGLALQSIDAVSQGACAGGVFPCALGALASGASATVTATFAVGAFATSVTNTATVSGPEPDSTPGNDQSALVSTVTPQPAVCGDGFVTGAEKCDAGNSATHPLVPHGNNGEDGYCCAAGCGATTSCHPLQLPCGAGTQWRCQCADIQQASIQAISGTPSSVLRSAGFGGSLTTAGRTASDVLTVNTRLLGSPGGTNDVTVNIMVDSFGNLIGSGTATDDLAISTATGINGKIIQFGWSTTSLEFIFEEKTPASPATYYYLFLTLTASPVFGPGPNTYTVPSGGTFAATVGYLGDITPSLPQSGCIISNPSGLAGGLVVGTDAHHGTSPVGGGGGAGGSGQNEGNEGGGGGVLRDVPRPLRAAAGTVGVTGGVALAALLSCCVCVGIAGVAVGNGRRRRRAAAGGGMLGDLMLQKVQVTSSEGEGDDADLLAGEATGAATDAPLLADDGACPDTVGLQSGSTEEPDLLTAAHRSTANVYAEQKLKAGARARAGADSGRLSSAHGPHHSD